MKLKKYKIIKPNNEPAEININLDSVDYFYEHETGSDKVILGIGGQFFVLDMPLSEFEKDVNKHQILKG